MEKPVLLFVTVRFSDNPMGFEVVHFSLKTKTIFSTHKETSHPSVHLMKIWATWFSGGTNYSVFPPQPIHVGCIDHPRFAPVNNHLTLRCWPAELGKHANARQMCAAGDSGAKFLSDIVYLNCLLGTQDTWKVKTVESSAECVCVCGGVCARDGRSRGVWVVVLTRSARQESDRFLYARRDKARHPLRLTHTNTGIHTHNTRATCHPNFWCALSDDTAPI